MHCIPLQLLDMTASVKSSSIVLIIYGGPPHPHTHLGGAAIDFSREIYTAVYCQPNCLEAGA